MHKVMIIDDDVPMIRVLQQMIDWEALNLHIVGTTYSSAKAVHLFKETSPDIVISDIGLPQKNGIELAQLFTEMKPHVRIIFLTCHEDFHYAQQAVKLAVDDYLIKDKLTENQLKESLQKSIRMLRPKEAETDQKMSNYNIDLYKQGLLQRVIDGVNNESTLAYASKIGISWGYPMFLLGVLSINYSSYQHNYTQKDFSLIFFGIYNIAVELSAAYEGITAFTERDNIVLIYNYRVNLANNAWSHLQNYLNDLRSQCIRFLKVELNSVILKDQLELQAIGNLYQQIADMRNVFYEGGDVVTASNRMLQNVFLSSPLGFLDPYKPELERAILKNDVEAVQSIVHQMGESAQEHRIDPKEFVRNITFLLRSLEMVFSSPKADEEQYFYISSARTLEDMSELTIRKLVQIMQNRENVKGPAIKEPRLKVIQQYIDEHLSENITSIDMAQYLFLNSSYFSRYFKRLAGINFTDYVHQYKMKIAEKMLKTSNQPLESLAMSLGYSDRNYFSKVFKKYTGMTPSEYKSKQTIIGSHSKGE